MSNLFEFRGFANSTAAAREHLAVDLGEYVCALLEQQDTSGWSPDPSGWRPEYTQDQATQG